MLTVNSTEFQNRIGYYTDLLEEGITIRLYRKKPSARTLILKAQRVEENDTEVNQKQKILKLREKYKTYKPKYYSSGLQLQNVVRT